MLERGGGGRSPCLADEMQGHYFGVVGDFLCVKWVWDIVLLCVFIFYYSVVSPWSFVVG